MGTGGRVVYLADSLIRCSRKTSVLTHGTPGKDPWLFAGAGDDPPHRLASTLSAQNAAVHTLKRNESDGFGRSATVPKNAL